MYNIEVKNAYVASGFVDGMTCVKYSILFKIIHYLVTIRNYIVSPIFN